MTGCVLGCLITTVRTFSLRVVCAVLHSVAWGYVVDQTGTHACGIALSPVQV